MAVLAVLCNSFTEFSAPVGSVSVSTRSHTLKNSSYRACAARVTGDVRGGGRFVACVCVF